MIREIVLSRLGQAINRVLATDPLAFDALIQLAGKTLMIECPPLKTPIYVTIQRYGIQLNTACDSPVTVSLRGTPSALLAFAKHPDQTKMLMEERVKLHGEIDFLLKLKHLAAQTELDIEGLVAEYLGDTAAHRLGLLAKHVYKRARTSWQSLSLSTTLYLQEESDLLPSSAEVEAFVQDVQRLRQDSERLEARINRLQRGLA